MTEEQYKQAIALNKRIGELSSIQFNLTQAKLTSFYTSGRMSETVNFITESYDRHRNEMIKEVGEEIEKLKNEIKKL